MGLLRSNRSFLRLFCGRIVTNAGDSLYAVAAMWLVYDLTGSSFYTGIAGFLLFSAQPLQVLLGPLVDRWSLRRVLVGTQLVQLVGVLVVPLAAATGYLSVWLVLAVVPLLELLNQVVYPAQHAALPRIVEEDRLVRANSLFSFAYQGTDMVFNAAAGVLITAIGAVALYVVDAVTFAVALALFAGLTIPGGSTTPAEDDEAGSQAIDQTGESDGIDDENEGYVASLLEGITYLRGSTVVPILLGAVVVNFAFGMAVAVLPAFADSLGNATAYGLLTAAMAGGTLLGAGGASFVEDVPYGRVQVGGRLLSAVCFFGAVSAPGTVPTVVLFFAAFVPGGAAGVLSSSLFQSTIDDSLLGRVVSVRNSTSTLLMPFGSLLGGIIATAIGSTAVVAGMGVASAFLAMYYATDPRLRSLPSVTDADETTLGLR